MRINVLGRRSNAPQFWLRSKKIRSEMGGRQARRHCLRKRRLRLEARADLPETFPQPPLGLPATMPLPERPDHQIDQTYGHLLPDSEDYLRGLLDNYDAATATEGGRLT